MQKIIDITSQHFETKELCRCGGAHKYCLHCQKCVADQADQIFKGDNLAHIIDATVLKANSTISEVERLCETAKQHHCASVCINSYFITLVSGILDDELKTCTVINFPLGSSDNEAVFSEAKAVIDMGVEELDMVMNLSAILSGEVEENLDCITEVAKLCIENGVLLKVILETCYLSEEQIILSCLQAKKAGADFVKTSTGFGSAGATEENIKLMRLVVGPKIGVKASGGIRDRQTALAMVSCGANRIGASSVTALLS